MGEQPWSEVHHPPATGEIATGAVAVRRYRRRIESEPRPVRETKAGAGDSRRAQYRRRNAHPEHEAPPPPSRAALQESDRCALRRRAAARARLGSGKALRDFRVVRGSEAMGQLCAYRIATAMPTYQDESVLMCGRTGSGGCPHVIVRDALMPHPGLIDSIARSNGVRRMGKSVRIPPYGVFLGSRQLDAKPS